MQNHGRPVRRAVRTTPYARPLNGNSRNESSQRPSLLSRVKSLVSSAWTFSKDQDEELLDSNNTETNNNTNYNNNTNTNSQTNGIFSHPFGNKNVFTYPPPEIPRPSNASSSSAPPPIIDTNQIMKRLGKYDGPKNPGSPYKMLADFFERKASEPLTDVEVTGVVALLNQLQSKSDTTETVYNNNNQMVSINSSPIGRLDRYPNTLNGFVPNSKRQSLVKNIPDSQPGTFTFRQHFGSKKQANNISHNNSANSESKNQKEETQIDFKPRRITHLASLPTPYRPATDAEIYKPHHEVEKFELEEDSENSFANLTTCKGLSLVKSDASYEQPEKGNEATMSQTASTMLSLINPVDEDIEEPRVAPKRKLGPSEVVSPPSKALQRKRVFVNPYSSTASRSTSRTYKKLPTDSDSDSFNILKSLERTIPDQESSDGLQSFGGSLFNHESPEVQRRLNITQPDKYRPVKSSSLRTTLLSESSDAYKFSRPNNVSGGFTASHARPKITPQWSAPDDDDDDDDMDMKTTEKSEEKENVAKGALSNNPGAFSLQGIQTAAATGELPKAQNTPKKSEPINMFNFGSSNPKDQAFKGQSFGVSNHKSGITKNEDKKTNTAGSGSLFGNSSSSPLPAAQTGFGFNKSYDSEKSKENISTDDQVPSFSIKAAAESTPVATGKIGLFPFGGNPNNFSTPARPVTLTDKGLFNFGSRAYGHAKEKGEVEEEGTQGMKQISDASTVDVEKETNSMPSTPFSFNADNEKSREDAKPLFGLPRQEQSAGVPEPKRQLLFGNSQKAPTSSEPPKLDFGGLANQTSKPVSSSGSSLFGSSSTFQPQDHSKETNAINKDDGADEVFDDEEDSSPQPSSSSAVVIASRQSTDVNPEEQALGSEFKFPDSFMVQPPQAQVEESVIKSFRENDFVF